MKKSFLMILAIILCALCLFACNNDEASNSDNSTDSDTNNPVDVTKLDLQNVENLQCKISFGQTGEELVFEKEKTIELYNIISGYECTKLNHMPVKDSVNPSKDYVYLHFTGDSSIEENFSSDYGHYTVYADDTVAWNLSVYMSSIYYYQYEGGLYDQINQYITENC